MRYSVKEIESRLNNISGFTSLLSFSKRWYVLYRAETYIVGGFIRDTLLGKDAQDVDVSILLPLDQYNNFVYGEHVYVGRFMTPYFEGNMRDSLSSFSFSLTRKEISIEETNYYLKSQIIEDDIMRRDFTMNALFLRLPDYKLFDSLHGIKDIEDSTIRAIYSETFFFDPSRMIRALRYKHALCFRFERQTESSIEEYLVFWSKRIAEKQINEYCRRRLGREMQRSLLYHYSSKDIKSDVLLSIENFLSMCGWKGSLCDLIKQEKFCQFFLV